MSRTPHDKLFKQVFKDPRYAAEELRSVLPAKLVAAVDWKSLKRESETHVDASLADVYSDLVFSARAGGGRVRIYVLFEHQSTNDDRMALRLLEYMVRMWTQFVRDEKNAGEPLPIIIPVVLAHAPGGWTAKRRFTELFAKQSVGLAPWAIPDFEYAVDDLSKVEPEALRARPTSDAVKLTLWVLRDARSGARFLAGAGDWVGALERLARDPRLRHVAMALVRYLWFVLDEQTMEGFRVMLANEAPMAEGLTMTCGEKLLEQGRLRGETERAASSVLRVLEARGLPVSDAQRARVERCRDVDTLERWLQAAVTAESAEAALR